MRPSLHNFKRFHHQKETRPISKHYLRPPAAPGSHEATFYSVDLSLPDISHGQNHTTCGLWARLLWASMFSRFIPGGTGQCFSPFHGWVTPCMERRFLYPLTSWQTLRYFHLSSVMMLLWTFEPKCFCRHVCNPPGHSRAAVAGRTCSAAIWPSRMRAGSRITGLPGAGPTQRPRPSWFGAGSKYLGVESLGHGNSIF